MIFAIVSGPTFNEANEQIDKANRIAEGIELRLDFFSSIDIKQIALLKARCRLPIIFTLRSVMQGGFFRAEKESRLKLMKELLKLTPDYMDISEHEEISYLKDAKSPQTHWIYSYHNCQSTPSDLEEIYLSMQHPEVAIYKICTFANSTLDSLRLLLWAKKKNATHKKIIAICMGEKGQITRILSPLIKNYLQFGLLDSKGPIAPGLLTIEELKEIYLVHTLNDQTAIYGLIGNPVVQSPSHHTHNLFFRNQGLNAVYVKMILDAEELDRFLPLAAELGFRGLSVTIPFKEEILKHIKEVDPYAQSIGAVNTLLFTENETWKGYNTDAPAALDAIEAHGSVKGKKIILLGAGGAARAIAFEAKRRGASVEVFTRDITKRSWNPAWQIPFYDLRSFSKKITYDALINATPRPDPISDILPDKILLDVNTSHRETTFLTKARKLNCKVIEGLEMFERQAVMQMNLWFNLKVHKLS